MYKQDNVDKYYCPTCHNIFDSTKETVTAIPNGEDLVKPFFEIYAKQDEPVEIKIPQPYYTMWMDDAEYDPLSRFATVRCPRCGGTSIREIENNIRYCCEVCHKLFTPEESAQIKETEESIKNEKPKDNKMPNFPEEMPKIYLGGCEAVTCPSCEMLISVGKYDYGAYCGFCNSFFKISKTENKKEKKMLKVISDVYEKTSDAVLVEKHFGICHGVFNDSNPMDAILINGFKEEILKKAKELEKAENDKKV